MSILENKAGSKELVKADEFRIVNHIFLRNCHVSRNLNACLSQYSLKRLNVTGFSYSYLPKARRGDAETSF